METIRFQSDDRSVRLIIYDEPQPQERVVSAGDTVIVKQVGSLKLVKLATKDSIVPVGLDGKELNPRLVNVYTHN